MARKDFDRYYDQIANQYRELNHVLENMNKELQEGMIEPERVDNLKLTLAPVITSYQQLSYIKYLLDMPTRRNKVKRYKSSSKSLKEAKNNTGDVILSNNDKVIQNVKL